MSALRRLVAASFTVAVLAGLAAAAPVAGSAAAPASSSTVVAIGPGCCK
ncbi:MAG TPA: hypothetical protein VFL94_04075 [Actinomycetales bacterium]|nr:hypothetical protein [Actinomycetales bacterium]